MFRNLFPADLKISRTTYDSELLNPLNISTLTYTVWAIFLNVATTYVCSSIILKLKSIHEVLLVER